jgi:hypothetical protein
VSVIDESTTLDGTTASRRWVFQAAYLGMSWTWVIGMFLPVLLVRDYGPFAWLIFALPNVIGAAWMGWAIKSSDHAAAMVRVHLPAMRVFTLVTVAFHVFFVLWWIGEAVGLRIASAILALMLLGMFAPLPSRSWAAAGVWLVSMCLLFLLGGSGVMSMPPTLEVNPLDLAALAVVCVLGFLACPYLDLTFQRVAEASDARRPAFGVGFGVFFLSMIVGTLLYAPAILERRLDATLTWILVAHLSIQAAFTVSAHARQLERKSPAGATLALAVAVAVGVAAALTPRAAGVGVVLSDGMAAGEVVYRLFMAFYGLVAPAYVWICVYPTRGFVAPDRRQRIVTAIVIVLASPLFAIAFFDRQMVWGGLGVLIVLAGRLGLDRVRRDFIAEHKAEMRGAELRG